MCFKIKKISNFNKNTFVTNSLKFRIPNRKWPPKAEVNFLNETQGAFDEHLFRGHEVYFLF